MQRTNGCCKSAHVRAKCSSRSAIGALFEQGPFDGKQGQAGSRRSRPTGKANSGSPSRTSCGGSAKQAGETRRSTSFRSSSRTAASVRKRSASGVQRGANFRGQFLPGKFHLRPPESAAPIPVETPAKAVTSPSLVRATEASDSVAGEKLPEAPAAVPDVVVQRLAPAPLPISLFRRHSPHRPKLPTPAVIACGILTESQAAVSRGLQALGDELACYARRSMETLACTAIDTLSVKTWSDAVAVNSRLARTSFDQWVDSAAKVSELGIKLANDAAKPLLAKMGVAWRPVPPG